MKCYNVKQLMRNTLELVEVVLSDEERTVFMSDGATDEDLERVGKSIENKCLTKILEYEGTDPEVEEQVNKSRKRQTQKKGHILLLKEEYDCTKIIWLQLPATTPTPELKG
jgi:hypothetical protein